MEIATIPDELAQQVIESSDYVAALEDVLEKAKRTLFTALITPEAIALRNAIKEAELLR